MKSQLITFILGLMTGVGGSTFANEAPLTSWNAPNCGLSEYIREYNSKHPERELYLEDLSRVAVASSAASPPLVKIDDDVILEQLTDRIVRCMVDSTSLESTLQAAYDRYFADRSSRRALWLFFKQIDAVYIREAQRVESVQLRESYLVTVTKTALYSTFATAFSIFLARRARSPVPISLPSVVGPQAKIPFHARLGMNFRQGFRNVGKLAVVAGSSGVAFGTPIYFARKYGWLSSRHETSVDQAERIYHRLHWLELDCRARQLAAELHSREYRDGYNDPQFKRDTVRVNHLINDLDYLIDVSQLYYAEVEWPKQMKFEEKAVIYENLFVKCPAGFSKTDPTQVTISDVRKAVAQSGVLFLKSYAEFMLTPVSEKLNGIMARSQNVLKESFDKEADPFLKTFFADVSTEVVSMLSAPLEKILSGVNNYLAVPKRLEGRAGFYKKWEEFFDKKIPTELQKELVKFSLESIGILPPPLMNQLILDQFAKYELYPANLIVLFNLGVMLEGAAHSKMISDRELYILPHEFMFSLYGKLDEAKP